MKSVTRSQFMSLLPPMTAGVVAVLVGFTSSVAIIFQAANAAGASTAQISSWVFALCFGAGLTSILFSFYYRMPILTAWSTPGAALLSTSLLHVPMSEAIGAFLFSALLVTVVGVTGWFERAVNRIPVSIASAMLAGVLLRFGLDVFTSLKVQPQLVLSMLVAYFIAKRFLPRYAIICVLLVGIALAAITNQLHLETLQLKITEPLFTMPTFSWSVLLSVGLPLFIVTMASQNLTGVAVMHAAGYKPPLSPIITGTGLFTLLLAPFGGFSINLAAMTAAICSGPEAHKEPGKRYIAAISAGVFYILIALVSSVIITLMAALPKDLVLALAGIALFTTITNGLTTAVREDHSREAAIITFIVTASGISIAGISAPFWGLFAGIIALLSMKPRGAKA